MWAGRPHLKVVMTLLSQTGLSRCKGPASLTWNPNSFLFLTVQNQYCTDLFEPMVQPSPSFRTPHPRTITLYVFQQQLRDERVACYPRIAVLQARLYMPWFKTWFYKFRLFSLYTTSSPRRVNMILPKPMCNGSSKNYTGLSDTFSTSVRIFKESKIYRTSRIGNRTTKLFSQK